MPGRKMVSLRQSTYDKVESCRTVLSDFTERNISRADVIDRALDSLLDAHTRGAWLSPKEAAPVLEDRHRREIVSVVGQFIARIMPERRLTSVSFDPSKSICVIQLDGDEQPIPLLVQGIGVAQGGV